MTPVKESKVEKICKEYNISKEEFYKRYFRDLDITMKMLRGSSCCDDWGSALFRTQDYSLYSSIKNYFKSIYHRLF